MIEKTLKLLCFVFACFVFASCTSLERGSGVARNPANTNLYEGFVRNEKATDISSDNSAEQTKEGCSFEIVSSVFNEKAGADCFVYRVKTSFSKNEITLTSDQKPKLKNACDPTIAVSERLPKDDEFPKALSIQYTLQFTSKGNVAKFYKSGFFGFSSENKVCAGR